MRATVTLALALAAATLPALAHAEEADPFADAATLAADDLDSRRGGTEILVPGTTQVAETSQDASNAGNAISISQGGRMRTGDIHTANVNGNHGITAVMQNTGNLVNMNNATSINVYTR